MKVVKNEVHFDSAIELNREEMTVLDDILRNTIGVSSFGGNNITYITLERQNGSKIRVKVDLDEEGKKYYKECMDSILESNRKFERGLVG